jgi:Flp pilus assembly pilin Flp
MRKFLSHLWNDESGISSVEYALLLSFVAVGIIFGASELSLSVNSKMTVTAICLDGGTCS